MKNKLQKMLLPHAKIFLLGIALQLTLASTLVAQGVNVTGNVTSSEDGEGLPGVNIIIKGTSQGTVTDVEGNFAIEALDATTVLVFSSVGYTEQELIVGNQSTVNISMVADITALEAFQGARALALGHLAREHTAT